MAALSAGTICVGADSRGERLNALYRENIDEAGILGELDRLFARYAAEREDGEDFGDFVCRAGIVPFYSV